MLLSAWPAPDALVLAELAGGLAEGLIVLQEGGQELGDAVVEFGDGGELGWLRSAEIVVTGGDSEAVVDIDDAGWLTFFALGDEFDAFLLEIGNGFAERGTLGRGAVKFLAEGCEVGEALLSVLVEFFFEVGEGGLGIEGRGFEGPPHFVALVVEDAIQQAAMFSGWAARAAGIGEDIVLAEDGIVFLEAGEPVVTVDFFKHLTDVVKDFRVGTVSYLLGVAFCRK